MHIFFTISISNESETTCFGTFAIENYEGKIIKACLALKENSDLFETYCNKSDELDSKKPYITSDVEPETPRFANSEGKLSQRNFGKISSEIMFSSYPIMKFIKGEYLELKEITLNIGLPLT